jgi:hypothetical protein
MIITVVVRTGSQNGVSKIIDLITKYGGTHAGASPQTWGDRIGAPTFAVVAKFTSDDQVAAFERDGFSGAAMEIVDHEWDEADVAPWYGKRGSVRFGKEGVSATFTGRIEPVDATMIRVVPRANLGGLDLGDSSYGGDGRVGISSIRSIEPA